jgi:hypothetical protein
MIEVMLLLFIFVVALGGLAAAIIFLGLRLFRKKKPTAS